MEMTVRVEVDPDACIGSGECVALDPAAIEIDDEGCARMLIRDLDESRAKALCNSCPVGALSIAR
jgi:ferredoxin